MRDDLGESKNLAAQIPGKVKELDSLIEGYLKDTAATFAQPNPDHKLRAGANSKAAQ